MLMTSGTGNNPGHSGIHEIVHLKDGGGRLVDGRRHRHGSRHVPVR